jgi:hypothetical protein
LSSANSNNPLAQDLAAVGKSLQAGDLTGAQSAFQKLQQDFQAQSASGQTGQTEGAHHHGHHHLETDQTAAASTTAPASTISFTA